MCEMACQIIQKKQEEKKIEEEQAAKAQNSMILACCDDDDDYNFAITPNELVDSLSMGDEHLNTISETKSDEFIKSCVENLVPNPSESEDENGCDVLTCFTTFSNILFDAEYEFDSSDDQSLSDEDFPKEIFSNPLFEEEIISTKIDPHHFDAEPDLIESMLNHDSFIISSSSKIDSLLNEFTGELTLLKSIPPGIDETDCYHENDIHLIERLLYDNLSPRPPEEFVSKNSDADIESFSPSPIPVEDSDSHMKEIDLPFTPDDLMPSGIEEDDYDSERDVLILEEFLDNYSLSLPVIESYHFDIPSFFVLIQNHQMVKDNQEKNKIGTKPDKNGKRRKARQYQRPITVKKTEKEKKIQSKGTKNKNEYETWAMKMKYWIMNTDRNLWKIIQNGNSKKSLGRDSKGGIIILLPVSFEEHVAIQRETKARTFGGNEESKKIRKTMLKQEFSEFSVSEEEGLHKGYDSTNTKMVYSDQPSHSSSITYTYAHSGSIMEDVLHSFVAENESTQQLAYEDFEQVDQLEMEELDIKWQMAMLSLRINKFQKKAGRKINFNNIECNVKKVDEKARYFAFKILEVKSEEPKAMAKIEKKEWEVKFVKSLARFVKAGRMHEVPPPITGTFMPTSYKSDLEETQATFGSKSNTSSINTSESNDFVSCDNSDKSSALETYDFASCVSSPKTNDSFSTVDVKILPKSDVKDPSPTNGLLSYSFKENVKPPRNLCNKSGKADRIHCKNNFIRTKKCFVCGSKSHLIKDGDVYDTVNNLPSVISKASTVPAGSRNSSASTSAGRSIPAASRNRPASINAG
nr:ribonuclease H-like domain-containing protein [Tanacetum cinerariifolium]